MSLGTLYIISAPSGAGKTSLVKALLEQDNQVRVSVSHTTRAPRPGEENGKDYHFVSLDTFETMVNDDQFLEHAQVFSNHYGTSKQSVNDLLGADKDVILEIDWQGAQQIRHAVPDVVSVFILPPSRTALRERLENRGQDDATIIDNRMQQAVNEMSHYGEYDFIIINDVFNTALSELAAIFMAGRQKQITQAKRHRKMIAELIS